MTTDITDTLQEFAPDATQFVILTHSDWARVYELVKTHVPQEFIPRDINLLPLEIT